MWLMNLFGVQKVIEAVARLAAAYNGLAEDVESVRQQIRGTPDPARIAGPEGKGKKGGAA